jgi:hypothetical protein
MFVYGDCSPVLLMDNDRGSHGSDGKEDCSIDVALPGMRLKRDDRPGGPARAGFSGILHTTGTFRPLTPNGIAAAAI